jgi:hypothetical protein
LASVGGKAKSRLLFVLGQTIVMECANQVSDIDC